MRLTVTPLRIVSSDRLRFCLLTCQAIPPVIIAPRTAPASVNNPFVRSAISNLSARNPSCGAHHRRRTAATSSRAGVHDGATITCRSFHGQSGVAVTEEDRLCTPAVIGVRRTGRRRWWRWRTATAARACCGTCGVAVCGAGGGDWGRDVRLLVGVAGRVAGDDGAAQLVAQAGQRARQAAEASSPSCQAGAAGHHVCADEDRLGTGHQRLRGGVQGEVSEGGGVGSGGPRGSCWRSSASRWSTGFTGGRRM